MLFLVVPSSEIVLGWPHTSSPGVDGSSNRSGHGGVPEAKVSHQYQHNADPVDHVSAYTQVRLLSFLGELLHYAPVEGLGLAVHQPRGVIYIIVHTICSFS